MKRIMIFGKKYTIVEKKSTIDAVQVINNKIIVKTHKKQPKYLLAEYLVNCLHSQLLKIYDEIKKEGKIEVIGNLDFEIVNSIDGKRQRIAKQKGNKILVKLNAVILPKSALRYIITHEIAHIFVKRHTRKFWKIVRTTYPNFKVGQDALEKYKEFLLTETDNVQLQ